MTLSLIAEISLAPPGHSAREKVKDLVRKHRLLTDDMSVIEIHMFGSMEKIDGKPLVDEP